MSNYSKLDKTLHRLFLDRGPLSEFLFQRLLKKSRLKSNSLKLSHIFVTGLPRAGTTAVLNNIYLSQDVGSFLYKFMPFILSPRLAKLFSENLTQEDHSLTERLHKDKIYINSNSPECLDEIFWIKASKDYFESSSIKEDLVRHCTLDAYNYMLTEFANLQNVQRLVIKNNNSHTRLSSLIRYFDSSYFIFLFRDPLFHSKSLLKTHINFLELQKNDPFILEYMNLIGHREFGQNIVPFHYNNQYQSKSKEILDPTNINYWLNQWIETHQWLLKSLFINNNNFYLLSYEKVCMNNQIFLDLCNEINLKHLPINPILTLKNSPKDLDELSFDKNLEEEAYDLYAQLCSLSFYE